MEYYTFRLPAEGTPALLFEVDAEGIEQAIQRAKTRLEDHLDDSGSMPVDVSYGLMKGRLCISSDQITERAIINVEVEKSTEPF
ncbi:MAG: hypothetical protein ABR924_18455 [Terracidiphilus sp.]|jgi:hypothetical protein